MIDQIIDPPEVNGASSCSRSASAIAAMNRMAMMESQPGPTKISRAAVISALDSGEVQVARRLMDEAFRADATVKQADEWAQLRDVEVWPDGWLIAAVRRDPPDNQALDALVNRYWKPLFARCQMLTLNHHRAGDLAQEAWCRVLRARRTLRPDGNFPAYLATVATNLWRDSNRSARRAGLMAQNRMASLDEELPGDEGGTVLLADVLPDLSALQGEEKALLKLDVDRALEQLNPLLRDVLVARFLSGESCAEIGRRHGRTQQTIRAWVREGMRQMKLHLEKPGHVPARKVEP